MIMKNKFLSLTLLMLTLLTLASCAGSRSGYGGGTHRKGYGCPATASNGMTVEQSKI